jgi:hypothetical protein
VVGPLAWPWRARQAEFWPVFVLKKIQDSHSTGNEILRPKKYVINFFGQGCCLFWGSEDVKMLAYGL